jgi:hypothetical protein
MSEPTYRIKPLQWSSGEGNVCAESTVAKYTVIRWQSPTPWGWIARRDDGAQLSCGFCKTQEDAKAECEQHHKDFLLGSLELVVPKTWAVYAEWDIMWNDADEGPVAAGDGCRLLKLCETEQEARAYVEPWQAALNAANQTSTVFPVPACTRQLRAALGWAPQDEDQMTENFRFVIKQLEEVVHERF